MGAPKNYPATIIGYSTTEQADAVREAAQKARISIAEFVRRACGEKLRRAERGNGKP
jgi:hypothetical protein